LAQTPIFGRRRLLAVLTCAAAAGRIVARIMLKQMAIAALLSLPAFAQTRTPVVRVEQLDEIRKIKCKDRVPENFGCAILFDVDFPSSGNMIASVVGGFVHQLSLILDHTMYSALYDPPLKRDDKFSGLRRNVRVPARVDGDDLIVQWPDGAQAKGRIIRLEKIDAKRPQPG
jgi:hypothetical protein